MISLKEFVPTARLYVPAAPNPVIEQQLRLAANEFCTKTRCWRDTFTTAISANPFALAPANTVIVAIERAEFDGVDLEPVAFPDLKLSELSDTGTPTKITSQYADAFLILPFTAGNLVVSAYLAPQQGARFGGVGPTMAQNAQGMVPDFLFNEHADAISHGAAARLMALPGQPFSGPQMAAYHDGLFQAAINAITFGTVRGKQRANLRTTPQWL